MDNTEIMSPTSLDDIIKVMGTVDDADVRFIAGGTNLVPYISFYRPQQRGGP